MRLLPLLPLFLLLAPRRPSPPCGRVFGQPARMACEVVIRAKTTGLLFLAFLLTIAILACGNIGGGSNGSESSPGNGSAPESESGSRGTTGATAVGQPTAVPATTGSFSPISVGSHHSCGVKTDGSVACWGLDEYDQSSPPSGSFSSVGVGNLYSCGVKTDGSIACWGNPKDGPVVDHGQSSPPSGSFSSISVGYDHSCGIKERRFRRLLGWRPAALRFLLLHQHRLRLHLRGEDRRLRRLLGVEQQNSAVRFLLLHQHRRRSRLRGENRRLHRLLGRR